MNFEEKILKMEEKNDVTHRRKKKKGKIDSRIFIRNHASRRHWNDIFIMLKEINCQPGIPSENSQGIPTVYNFTNEGKLFFINIVVERICCQLTCTKRNIKKFFKLKKNDTRWRLGPTKMKKKMLEIIGKFGKYKLPFISHFKISQKAVNCLRVSGG